MYDAKNRSLVTIDEARAAIGKQAVLPLTGRIIDAVETGAGVMVTFEVDERWGFINMTLGLDFDALLVRELLLTEGQPR